MNFFTVYFSVDEVAIWGDGLAEDYPPGALVGETFFVIFKDQFKRLRDGRIWYQCSLAPGLFSQSKVKCLSTLFGVILIGKY